MSSSEGACWKARGSTLATHEVDVRKSAKIMGRSDKQRRSALGFLFGKRFVEAVAVGDLE